METVAVSANAGGITGHVECTVFLTIPIFKVTYDKFEYLEFEHSQFQADKLKIEEFQHDVIDIVFLRRGVIGVRKIGYV